MNINFNTIISKSIPFVGLLSLAYGINTSLYYYLPKTVEYNAVPNDYNIEYNKYKFDNKLKEVVVVKKKPIKKKVVKKKEYKLNANIILKAIYSSNDNSGWIIIGEKSSTKTHMLSIGEKFKSFELQLVYSTYAIFTKDNKEYRLDLLSEKDKKAKFTTKKNIAVKKTETIKSEELNAIKQEDENQFALKRTLINNYTKNLKKIWRDIAIDDYKQNGILTGFKIRRINQNSVFAKLGLRDGDIIKSVNNIKMTSYSNAFSVYKKLSKTKDLSFLILRDNNEMELEYEIK